MSEGHKMCVRKTQTGQSRIRQFAVRKAVLSVTDFGLHVDDNTHTPGSDVAVHAGKMWGLITLPNRSNSSL